MSLLPATLASTDISWVEPRRVDWRLIMEDLRQRGLNDDAIATLLNYTRSTVQRWQMGSEPLFHNGQALLCLHAAVCSSLTQERLPTFRSIIRLSS